MLVIQRVVKSLFTSNDNETQDIVKWLASIAFLVGIFLTVWAVVVHKKEFDIVLYSTGVSALLVALAGALRLKVPADPAPTNTPTTLVADKPSGTTVEQTKAVSTTVEKTTTTS